MFEFEQELMTEKHNLLMLLQKNLLAIPVPDCKIYFSASVSAFLWLFLNTVSLILSIL